MPGNETIAKTLGYAGLIPFIIFSVGSWTGLPYISDSIPILIAYAAIILSFMGAIHWGAAMMRLHDQGSKYFINSIMPALAAWLSLLMPELYALIFLLVGFILLLAYDRYVEKSLGLPDWYIPLRITLTSIVTLCLTAALLSIIWH